MPRAHRDAQVRLGQRGGVVDAVADHGDPLSGRLEPYDLGDLVLRQHVGDHLVDARPRRATFAALVR